MDDPQPESQSLSADKTSLRKSRSKDKALSKSSRPPKTASPPPVNSTENPPSTTKQLSSDPTPTGGNATKVARLLVEGGTGTETPSATVDKEVEALILASTLTSSKAAQLLGETETVLNQTINQRHLQPEAEASFLYSKHQIPKPARVLGETSFLSPDEMKDYKILKQFGETQAIDRKTIQSGEMDSEVENLVLKAQAPSKAAKILGHSSTHIS